MPTQICIEPPGLVLVVSFVRGRSLPLQRVRPVFRMFQQHLLVCIGSPAASLSLMRLNNFLAMTELEYD